MKYKIIYADPPWSFNNKNTWWSMKSGASAHYDTMNIEDIKKIDINEICDENCILFMWWVWSQPQEAIDLVKSWGFKLKTMTAFNWVKQTKLWKMFFGMWFWTRAWSECCLIATRWKVKPIIRNMRSVVVAKVEQHSKKPNIFADKIVELCWDLPRLEMFARDKKDWWDLFGNECKNSINIK